MNIKLTLLVLSLLSAPALAGSLSQPPDVDSACQYEPWNCTAPTPPAVPPMVTYTDRAGNAAVVIDGDGTIKLDFGATLSWSRYFITETPPAKCRHVWVLTLVNGPGGQRPLYLQACEPITGKRP